jgi:hypothetical protein
MVRDHRSALMLVLLVAGAAGVHTSEPEPRGGNEDGQCVDIVEDSCDVQ